MSPTEAETFKPANTEASRGQNLDWVRIGVRSKQNQGGGDSRGQSLDGSGLGVRLVVYLIR